MEKEIQIFNHPQFGDIRCMKDENGEPWFVGKDVAESLGYQLARKAIYDHVDEEDKTTVPIQNAGSNYKTQAVMINESGLYSLVLSSKLPQAKVFKHWVTAEVLPQIRKTGGYIPIGKTDGNGGDTRWRNIGNGGNTRWRNSGNGGYDDDKTILCKALMIYKRTVDEKDKLLEEQRPKVEFADAVTASKGCIYIAQLANLLHQNGYETGQNRLFQTLRDKGFLYKGHHCTRPMQEYVEKGLFQVNVNIWTDPDGEDHESFTTMVTPKGQKFFLELFCK